VFKEEGQEYAQVTKMLGNGRLEAQCFDGTKRLAHIRGKMRKKVWINQGDIILLSLREYQDEKADVIQKYTADEARNLKAYGELPDTAKINETDTFGPEEDDIDFDFDIDEVSSFARIDILDCAKSFCAVILTLIFFFFSFTSSLTNRFKIHLSLEPFKYAFSHSIFFQKPICPSV
jgi:translation initiation factor 1A